MIGALSFAKAGAYHMGLIRRDYGWVRGSPIRIPNVSIRLGLLVGPRDEGLVTGGHW